jgi:hypothetical protein
MRKDYVNLMGNLLEFHNAKVISMFIQILMLWMKESFLQGFHLFLKNQLKIWLLRTNSGHQGTNQS